MTHAGQFRLIVFEGDSTEAAADFEGELENWAHYENLRLPGFDGTYSLALSGLWAVFFENGLEPLEQVLTGYETIVKFGGTMQLKQAFRVSLEINTTSH